MFTGSSRPQGVGDEIIAALFAGPKRRDADDLSAFARRANPGARASPRWSNPSSSTSPDGRIGAPR
jgi:hypothetical protein